MKCKQCRQDIQDGVRFCPLCGDNQQDTPKVGVLILDCQHCYSRGECERGRTHGRVHSCEYCVSKSGIRPTSLFPHVPCAYCEGSGKHTIDLKIQKPEEQKKGRRRNG